MLLCFLALLLGIVEATAYWHARNVLADAAADGAHAAAGLGGSCADGEAVARDDVRRRAGGWASAGLVAQCTDDGSTVTLTLAAPTPGVLGRVARWRAVVHVAVPRER